MTDFSIFNNFISFCDSMIIATESYQYKITFNPKYSVYGIDDYYVSKSDVEEHSLKLHKTPNIANLNHCDGNVSYYAKKFHDTKILTNIINRAIQANQTKINSFLVDTQRTKFSFDYNCSELIGYVLSDYDNEETTCLRIVLGSNKKRSEIHFVTAYPYPKKKCKF